MKTKLLSVSLFLMAMILLQLPANAQRAKLEVLEPSQNTGADGGAVEISQYVGSQGNSLIANSYYGGDILSTARLAGYKQINGTYEDFGAFVNGGTVGLIATYGYSAADDTSATAAYLATPTNAGIFDGDVEVNGNTYVDGTLEVSSGIGSIINMRSSTGLLLSSIINGLGLMIIKNEVTGSTFADVKIETENGSLRVDDGGAVCVATSPGGTTITAYGLSVAAKGGTAYKTDGVSTWTIPSDRRLKENIEDYTDGLELVKKIKPYWYNYTGEFGLPSDHKIVGVLAQDLQKVAPYMVSEMELTEGNDQEITKKEKFLAINIDALRYAMVNAIQEQQAQIENLAADKEQLQSEVERLSNENDELYQRIENIEQLLAEHIPALQNEAAKTTTTFGNNTKARLDQNAPNPFDQTTTINYFVPENTAGAK
ncbi:MAG: tail fiber domain-containing protein, partial [Bacteroidetes bacterium]|nr:tail fiber domain-containing protein [Bacteroidota bacterium]